MTKRAAIFDQRIMTNHVRNGYSSDCYNKCMSTAEKWQDIRSKALQPSPATLTWLRRAMGWESLCETFSSSNHACKICHL